MNTFLVRTEALLYELNTTGGKKHKCTVDCYELIQNLKKEDFEKQTLAEDQKRSEEDIQIVPKRLGSDIKPNRSGSEKED